MEHQQLFDSVKKLAKEGKSPREIALALGFKTQVTFQARLIEASMTLSKPVPLMKKSRGGTGVKVIEQIQVRKSKGDKMRISIPHEPISRAGIAVDAVLSVKVLKGRIILSQ